MASFFMPISAIIKLMLRLRRGGTKTEKVEQRLRSIWFNAVIHKVTSKNKTTLLIGGATAGLAAIAVALLFVSGEFNDHPSETVFITQQQAIKSDLEKLKQNAPPATASLEQRTRYLDELTRSLAENGDYRGAIAMFDRRTSLAVDDLTYRDYIRLAGYNHAINDKDATMRSLDKAVDLLPPTDDQRTGFYHDLAAQLINDLRTEYIQ